MSENHRLASIGGLVADVEAVMREAEGWRENLQMIGNRLETPVMKEMKFHLRNSQIVNALSNESTATPPPESTTLESTGERAGSPSPTGPTAQDLKLITKDHQLSAIGAFQEKPGDERPQSRDSFVTAKLSRSESGNGEMAMGDLPQDLLDISEHISEDGSEDGRAYVESTTSTSYCSTIPGSSPESIKRQEVDLVVRLASGGDGSFIWGHLDTFAQECVLTEDVVRSAGLLTRMETDFLPYLAGLAEDALIIPLGSLNLKFRFPESKFGFTARFYVIPSSTVQNSKRARRFDALLSENVSNAIRHWQAEQVSA